MNIGAAIKIFRKEKGYSQKKLAEECGLSVNALCQIEKDATFPQKSTIKKICKELDIPVSYLLFFSIDDSDVPDHKKVVFKSLNSAIRNVLLDSELKT